MNLNPTHNILRVIKYFSFLVVSFTFCLLVVSVVYWCLESLEYVKYAQLKKIGYFLESFCLALVLLLLFIVSKRFLLSAILVIFLYGLFIYLNIEKSTQLLTPIFFNDINLIVQLMLVEDVLSPYLINLTSIVLVIIFTIFITLRYEPKSIYLKSTWITNLFLILFISLFSFKYKIQIKDILRFDYSVRINNSHALNTAESYGFLFFFIKDSLYSKSINQVEHYSKNYMDKIRSNLKSEKSALNVRHKKPSLIIYLIESFADPQRAGIQTTEDAIPFFRSLTQQHLSGQILSPVFGGNSANSEFELLTGFSMHFFPKSSIAYLELPDREIPSIARELGQHGYHSTAIQPVDLGFFNYKHIYQKLGFDETISLWGKEGIKKDPAGRYPSDESVVQEIINISEQHKNFFVFAFPNSTHSNWNYSAYENSSLDLNLSTSLKFPGGAKQLKTYVNALKTADNSIKQLIKHFENKNEPVAILILGDHQPGLPEFREQFMSEIMKNELSYNSRKEMKVKFKKIREKHPIKYFEKFHEVPYVLWTNFETNQRYQYQKGMNSLILAIIELMKISPTSPFYDFLMRYSKAVKYNSLLKYNYQENSSNYNQELQWNKDFEAIQYDLLFGSEYITK